MYVLYYVVIIIGMCVSITYQRVAVRQTSTRRDRRRRPHMGELLRYE